MRTFAGARRGTGCFGVIVVLCGLTLGAARARAQAQTPTQTGTTPARTPVSAQNPAAANRSHAVHHRTPRRHTSAVQTLPLEKASPASTQSSQAAAASEARQRAADARLLKQQEAQSARDAAINDRMVQRAQARQDAQQNQVRIQDAPGPAQTGVVPAAGAPVQPAQTDQRIQDQPSPVPGQNTNPPQA